MEQLGAAAAERLDAKPTQVPGLSPLTVLARNTLFLVLVLAHIARRMLPPYGIDAALAARDPRTFVISAPYRARLVYGLHASRSG